MVKGYKHKLLPLRTLMWVGLVLIILLMCLSIVGTFLGTQRTARLFNSPPLAIYWLILTGLLAVALVAFRRLLRLPGLLAMHFGSVLVLVGAMVGSEVGHYLQQQLFGISKIRSGYMVIYEGHSENNVLSEDFQRKLGTLPFDIALRDFRIEYYGDESAAGLLQIQTRDEKKQQIVALPGRELELSPGEGTIKILRVFRNFRISLDGDERVITDQPGPAENPAVEVQLERPDGTQMTRYVFELFGGHDHQDDDFVLSYVSAPKMGIRDYLSDVEVLEDKKPVKRKLIEVNHPLYYRGYHFYQHSYDSQNERYTILSVVSDAGLYVVYAGYCLLCAGLFWHFWLRHIRKVRVEKTVDI